MQYKIIKNFVEKVNKCKEGYVLFYNDEEKFYRREGKKKDDLNEVTISLRREGKEVFSFAWTENDVMKPDKLFYILKGCKKIVLHVAGDESIDFVHDKDSTENACLTLAYRYCETTFLIIARQGKRLLLLSDIEADEENPDAGSILKSIILNEEQPKQSDSQELFEKETIDDED